MGNGRDLLLNLSFVSNLSQECQDHVEKAFVALNLSPEIANNFDDLLVILLDVFQHQAGLPEYGMIVFSTMLFVKFFKDDDAVLSFSEVSLVTLHKLAEEGLKSGTGNMIMMTVSPSILFQG